MKKIKMEGKKFNRLKVIKEVDTGKEGVYWLCRCDCGNEKVIRGVNIRKGRSKSCGCLRVEGLNARSYRHGFSRRDATTERIYSIWSNMKDRCLNDSNKEFHRYGGRGIAVCDEWKGSYENFRAWALSNNYNDNLQIDRINNDGGYSPSNCRFVTAVDNVRNSSIAKLDEGKVRLIKTMFSNGFGRDFLMRYFNASRSNLNKILNGTAWSDITI